MSAETIPADVIELVAKTIHDHWQGAPGLSARPWDGEKGTCTKLPAQAEDFRRKARAVMEALATRPAEPAALTVDTIAAFLHKEVEWPEDNYPAYAWPEVDGDTGQRDGGYVKIVPKYVVEEFRGIARRLLIAFRQEGVVPTEPAARVAEAGDGEVALKSLLAAIQLGHAACDADESSSDLSAFREAYGAHNAIEQLLANLRSTLETERARADAAEQRAADALACAEKAEAEKKGAEARETLAFEFDRYINGVLMAEGVIIERQHTLAAAMREAACIAARGAQGEVPVLVLKAPPRDLSQGGQHG